MRIEQDRQPVTIQPVSISRQAARAALYALQEHQKHTYETLVAWDVQGILDKSEVVRSVCQQQVAMRSDISEGLGDLIQVLLAAVVESSARTQ